MSNDENKDSREIGANGADFSPATCSQGEAIAASISVHGRQSIAVGIVGTKKCIAVCGYAGDEDEGESWANAKRIASDWNLHSENGPADWREKEE